MSINPNTEIGAYIELRLDPAKAALETAAESGNQTEAAAGETAADGGEQPTADEAAAEGGNGEPEVPETENQ